MPPIQAILFDCDGVLLDSEPPACAALARAIAEAGVPMTAAQAARIFSGNAAADSIGWMAAAGLDAQAVFARADDILFAMFDRHVPVMDGIERVVRGFDVAMAVCSNSGSGRLARSVARTAMAARFGGHIYSADQTAAPKPAPDLALLAAARLGVAPDRAVFIDDNRQGMACARAAGCLAVGFAGPSEHRPGHAAALLDAGADHVVHGAAALHELLARLGVPAVEAPR